MRVETELSVSSPSTERPDQDIETREAFEPLAPIAGVAARCSASTVGRTPRPAQVGQADLTKNTGRVFREQQLIAPNDRYLYNASAERERRFQRVRHPLAER